MRRRLRVEECTGLLQAATARLPSCQATTARLPSSQAATARLPSCQTAADSMETRSCLPTQSTTPPAFETGPPDLSVQNLQLLLRPIQAGLQRPGWEEVEKKHQPAVLRKSGNDLPIPAVSV